MQRKIICKRTLGSNHGNYFPDLFPDEVLKVLNGTFQTVRPFGSWCRCGAAREEARSTCRLESSVRTEDRWIHLQPQALISHLSLLGHPSKRAISRLLFLQNYKNWTLLNWVRTHAVTKVINSYFWQSIRHPSLTYCCLYDSPKRLG